MNRKKAKMLADLKERCSAFLPETAVPNDATAAALKAARELVILMPLELSPNIRKAMQALSEKLVALDGTPASAGEGKAVGA